MTTTMASLLVADRVTVTYGGTAVPASTAVAACRSRTTSREPPARATTERPVLHEVSAVCRARRRVLAVTGPPGAGKTTLLGRSPV